jgi:hypothetical protein
MRNPAHCQVVHLRIFLKESCRVKFHLHQRQGFSFLYSHFLHFKLSVPSLMVSSAGFPAECNQHYFFRVCDNHRHTISRQILQNHFSELMSEIRTHMH